MAGDTAQARFLGRGNECDQNIPLNQSFAAVYIMVSRDAVLAQYIKVKCTSMKSKLVQTLFHVSDGLNYICAGLCLICAFTMPFAIGIMNGFEGAEYTTFHKVLIFIISIIFAGLFYLITRHYFIAVLVLVVLYVASALAAKSVFPIIFGFVAVTSLPYILSLGAPYAEKNT